MLFCERKLDFLVRIVKKSGYFVYRLAGNDEFQFCFAVFGVDIRFALVDSYRKTEAVAGDSLYSVPLPLKIKPHQSRSAVVVMTYGKRCAVYH